MIDAADWISVLSSPETRALEAWIQENIEPCLGKDSPETTERLLQVHDSIQDRMFAFREEIMKLMAVESLGSNWFVLNRVANQIDVSLRRHDLQVALAVLRKYLAGDPVCCVELFNQLLEYCAQASLAAPVGQAKRARLDPALVQYMDLSSDASASLETGILPLTPNDMRFLEDFFENATDSVQEVALPGKKDTKIYDSDFLALKRRLGTAEGHLSRWKRNEELKERDSSKVISGLDDNYLSSVQECFESIVKDSAQLPSNERMELLLRLAQNLLVIRKQPESHEHGRVILTRCESSVRLLLGKQFLSSDSAVSVRLMNQDAKPVPKNQAGGTFVMKGTTSQLNTQQGTNVWTADFSISFPSLPKRLDKAKHPEMKTVYDENFWILYEVSLQFKGTNTVFKVHALSFPIKIIVNVSTLLQAWETMIWDNAGGFFGIRPIAERPSELPYHTLIQAINTRFTKVTGRPLSDQDFEVVVKKLYGQSYLEQIQNGTQHVTLEKYRTELCVPGLELDRPGGGGKLESISFCGWFYHLGKFIKGYLQQNEKRNGNPGNMNSLWADETVMGYIPPEALQLIFSNCTPGTFMLRLSGTTPNAITVDWIQNDGCSSYRATSTDLNVRSLPDRIMDVPQWKTLYSLFARGLSIPKEDVFAKAAESVHQDQGAVQIKSNTKHPLLRYVRALQLRLMFPPAPPTSDRCT